MIKTTFFLFLSLLTSQALAQYAATQSQDTTLAYVSDTLFTLGQESIPLNDSGGRWIQTNLLLKSTSAWPIHVSGFPVNNPNSWGARATCAPRFDYKPADSAWLTADSLMLAVYSNGDYSYTIAYGTPRNYKDSLPALGVFWKSYGVPMLQFTIPPHGTLRIPYLFQSIGNLGAHDTQNVAESFIALSLPWHTLDWFSDSIGGTQNKVQRRVPSNPYMYDIPPPIYAIASWSAPYAISFKGTWSNKQNPVVLGQYSQWYVDFQDTVGAFETTKTIFKIVGEYADRFVPPSDTDIRETCYNEHLPEIQWTFNGAPKSVVHDTLVSTMSDKWGTIVTRTPIEAYTVVRNGYQTRKTQYSLTAPFLGSANDTIVISNSSEFPIQLKNLQLQNATGQRNFRITSAPSVISAHDSGFIIATLFDNDKWQDADNPQASATITGTVVPYQTDIAFLDSAFTVYVGGVIDVYCPFSQDYFYYPPEIKHGIHPKGIVFISDKISNKCVSGKSSITIFGNNDSTSEYFYLPYYDDPHFSIKIRDFCGSGSATLPGLIPPDTAVLFPSTNTIQALTEFTGDDNHNYLTKLHWPRGNDTVTMDVLALGANAPPFDGVATNNISSDISIWPNPATSILHIQGVEEPSSFWISDALGRIIRRVYSTESELDISDLPPGLYEISFPSIGKSVKFLKL